MVADLHVLMIKNLLVLMEQSAHPVLIKINQLAQMEDLQLVQMDPHQKGEDALMVLFPRCAQMEMLQHVWMELLRHHVLMERNQDVLKVALLSVAVMREILQNKREVIICL